MVEERLLKLDEVGQILGVCRRSVERLIASGDLPVPVKIRRGSRLPASEVVAYIERVKKERDGAAARV